MRCHREVCAEANQSHEEPMAVGWLNVKLDHFAHRVKPAPPTLGFLVFSFQLSSLESWERSADESLSPCVRVNLHLYNLAKGLTLSVKSSNLSYEIHGKFLCRNRFGFPFPYPFSSPLWWILSSYDFGNVLSGWICDRTSMEHLCQVVWAYFSRADRSTRRKFDKAP